MGKPPTGSATAAFYIRLLVEGLQSRSRGHRVLEAGFTGMRVDKLGHKRYYRDGRQVKNPSPEEKQALASHGQQTAPSSGTSHSAAGGAPSASKSLSNLGPHADPEQVRSVANDLMRLSVKDLSKLASQPAEQATSHGNQSGIGEAGDLVSLDTNQIHVDPKRFQYKQSLDASTGTGDHLKGVNKFNPLFAGVVHAWKDPADGKTYVVNGHHRMELARRAGHQKMNVQMIIAPNATTARATGALINMAEGRGTALDAAKFLRDSKQSIEDLKGHGVSLKEKVVDNAVQLRGLSDRIFNDLLTGRLEEDKAVAIGRHLKDHDAQEQLYNHYLEQRDKHNKEFSAATLEQAAMDVANAPKQQGGGQMDLFGNTDDGKSLFLEKAELKNKLRAALAQEVNDYTVAGNARRAKNIAGAGNVLQVEKNKELSKAADRIKQGFEQFQHLAGPLSDAINAHVEDYASASPKQKRTIVEKALADARGAIQAIIIGGAENDLRAGAQDPQGDPSAGTTEPGTVSGDLRGGNAGDLGPSLFGPQDEPTPAAEKSAKPEEPGFTGIDAQGREWRNGELVAKQEEPKAASAGNGLDANALALDALRLKGNRKPHNAAHITVPALLELKEKGYINDAGQLTNDGRLYLYAQKGKPVRQATGPKAAKALVGPEAPAPERGSDAELAVLNALRLRANRKAHNSSLITPAAVASLQAQNLVDASGRITAQGRSYLTSQKAPVPAAPAPKTPSATSAPEKYFGTGGEHTVVVQNGKKLRIPAPLENVPGWTDYEPVAPKAFYNLDEQEVVEHREAQELVRREWPKFRQEYLTKMGTFDADGNLISITCNCDDWRDLFPTYKGTNSGSIHDAASYANMRMLNEAWALMKGKGNNQFLVLGGGGGSGKGTATKDIIQVTEYPVVLDSVSDDSAWTKELMDGAAKHGLDGQFVFIDRAPADAWKDGVVKRAMQAREKFDAGDPTSLARTVPLSVAVPANLKARRAALELFEEGKVPSIIINNNLGFGKAKQVDENAVAAYLQQGIGGYNKEELLKELENDTRGLYEQGKIPPDIAKGLLGARAIAGGRDQLRPTGASDSGRPATGRGADENPPGAPDQAPLDERGRAPGDSGEQGSQGKSSSEPVAPAADQPGFTGIDAEGREWRNGELVAKQEEPKQKRAAAGGEFGPNGEHYKGGAFIATTDMPKTIKHKIKQSAGDGTETVYDPNTGKTTQETPPEPGLMSIYGAMVGVWMDKNGYVNHGYLDYINADVGLRKKIVELAQMFKDGTKWVPINDYPEIAKGKHIYRLADAGLPINASLIHRMNPEFQEYFHYKKSQTDLKNDSDRSGFDKIQVDDKFKDKMGNEYVISKKGPGVIYAWPLINGEPRYGKDKKFAITDSAKQFYNDVDKSLSLKDILPAGTKPAADLFGNPLPDNKPKSPETMPGLFGEPVPIGADKPQSAPEPTTAGTDNPLDRPDAAKRDDTQDMFGLFGPGTKAKIDQVNNGTDVDPMDEPSTPAAAAAEPQKGDTPRAVANRVASANQQDYQFARNSSIGNFGEDIEQSARHNRRRWTNLESAEKEGTAEELVKRDVLLNSEPSKLMDKIEKGHPLSVLAAHLALKTFPKEPGIYKASKEDQVSTPEKLRAQYYEAFTTMKKLGEELAEKEVDFVKIVSELRKKTGELISKFRQTGQGKQLKFGRDHGDRFNPVANALVDSYNRLTNRGANSVLGKMNDFGKRLRAGKNPDQASDINERAATIKNHVMDILEGKSFNQTFDTVNHTNKRWDASKAYVSYATRKGGRAIDAHTLETGRKFLMEGVGLRGVQWGNSVTDKERLHHLQKTSEAMADLADVTGFSDRDISLGGQLGLAIGARGRGGAVAHYESDKNVINLTRKNGVGSLAHEWGHAMDHYLVQSKGSDNKKLYLSDATMLVGPNASPAEKSISKLLFADYHQSGYFKRLQGELLKDYGTLNHPEAVYFLSRSESFARIFETYVQQKLAADGRENTYLAGNNGHPYWPTVQEMKTLAPTMEAFLMAVKEEKFKKTTEAVMPTDKAAKIALVQAIISQTGAKPPRPKQAQEAQCEEDPRVKRIRELLAQRG